MPIGFTKWSKDEQATWVESYLRQAWQLSHKIDAGLKHIMTLHFPGNSATTREWEGWFSRNSPVLQTYVEKLIAGYFAAMRSGTTFQMPGAELL
jgi:hypothetical protein